MIEIIDDTLEHHNAELIDMTIRNLSWKYDYNSTGNGVNKHWHIFCGHTPEECKENGYEHLLLIWDAIQPKLKVQVQMERMYLNAHTHGIEPHPHIDDGDYTIIYYPRMDWQREFGGGTIIGNELIDYKGNRTIIFNASYLHQAQTVSRQCYKLRTCVVFKTKDLDNVRVEGVSESNQSV